MVQSNSLAQRYDLLPTMSKYLDPQLVFALTEFIRTRDIYDGREVLEAQIKVLWSTNMVEFTMELHKELHGPDSAPPQELEERKDVVIQRITQLQENAQKMIDVISNQTNVQGLRSDRKMNSDYLKVRTGLCTVQLRGCSSQDSLSLSVYAPCCVAPMQHRVLTSSQFAVHECSSCVQEQFGIGPEQVDTLYQYAKCIYECGSYKAAGELLHQYTTYSLDPLKLLSAMWGKLASEILDCNVRARSYLLPHV